MKAVGYLRVSGQGQITGTGFDRQKETIQSYARQAGVKITHWYKEAHTGTDLDRPVFNEMLEDLLSNGVRTILVESLDRLARDLTVSNHLIALLIRNEITLISTSTAQNITEAMAADPMMEALIQIQAVFAQLEKKLLVRKLKKAREQVRKQEGRCEGRKPYGLHPDPDQAQQEQEVIDRMQQLYRKPRGGKRRSYYKIAQVLNEEGCTTRSGGQWTVTQVQRVLNRLGK